MRLLQRNSDGSVSVTEDLHENIPAYAILSHTWGKEKEEVTFRDLRDPKYSKGRLIKSKEGYRKLKFCGDQAARDGLRYFWIDTCCIDRSNAVELNEAINSMFRWYRDAAKCYVYLSDVSVKDKRSSREASLAEQGWESAFRRSRWFTRGWTLQELLAPRSVEFFSSESSRLGSRRSLEGSIHEITGIPTQALQGNSLSEFSVDDRMLWAEKRSTKREEDWAYCLLGIFDIHMPLIYGEGKEHAVARLQKEVFALAGSDISMSMSTLTGELLIAPPPSVLLASCLKVPISTRFSSIVLTACCTGSDRQISTQAIVPLNPKRTRCIIFSTFLEGRFLYWPRNHPCRVR